MWTTAKRIRALLLSLDAERQQINEMQREIGALRTALGDAVSARRAEPAPVDNAIVLRMLTSIEELSGKFYQVWERERQQAREQRKNAAGKSVAKRAEVAVAAATMPARVLGCPACMDAIDGSRLATPLDALLHGREEHDSLYAEYLRPRPNTDR